MRFLLAVTVWLQGTIVQPQNFYQNFCKHLPYDLQTNIKIFVSKNNIKIFVIPPVTDADLRRPYPGGQNARCALPSGRRAGVSPACSQAIANSYRRAALLQPTANSEQLSTCGFPIACATCAIRLNDTHGTCAACARCAAGFRSRQEARPHVSYQSRGQKTHKAHVLYVSLR